MTLYGWRQMIEWSMEHACMSPSEYASVYEHWKAAWEQFLDWVIDEYEKNLSEEPVKPSL